MLQAQEVPRQEQEQGKGTLGKKKNFKGRGRAYVGEWISDDEDDEGDEQEEEEEDSFDDEEVTGIAIKCESSLPSPPICFMAREVPRRRSKTQ